MSSLNNCSFPTGMSIATQKTPEELAEESTFEECANRNRGFLDNREFSNSGTALTMKLYKLLPSESKKSATV